MKKVVRVVLLQIMFGWMMVGNAKAVTCGQVFDIPAEETPTPGVCPCTNNPVYIKYYDIEGEHKKQYCCGWMVNGACSSSEDVIVTPKPKYYCGQTYSVPATNDTHDDGRCQCSGSPLSYMRINGSGIDENNWTKTYCCGWLFGDNDCRSSITGYSTDYILCAQINEGTQRDKCEGCLAKDGIWTAIGCISQKPDSIVRTAITLGLGLGGGVAIIMILIGAFKLSVSQGDPNKTKEAKEVITSAIIGLLFVIFSITILQFIGVTVLHIPGFGE